MTCCVPRRVSKIHFLSFILDDSPSSDRSAALCGSSATYKSASSESPSASAVLFANQIVPKVARVIYDEKRLFVRPLERPERSPNE